MSRHILVGAAVAFGLPATAQLGSIPGSVAGSVSCPVDVPLSCQNTTAYDDTCCFNHPGGQVLLTQFWDTNPSTGPADSWTIHGLWPDNCDGSYEQYCDEGREYFNISSILADRAPCTLDYMDVFWKDYQGDDEDFWEHEFNKHGTCMSTLEPACYPDHQPGDEVVDYFKRTVKLFKTLPSYTWLADAGIVPSLTKTYTRAEIQAALVAHHGYEVIIGCRNGELDELWYHYNMRGSVPTGEFVPVAPVGSPSTCPATGIKYLPKYTPVPPTTTTTTSSSAITVPTGVPAALSGKGRLYVSTSSDANGGFLISGGTWYRAGGTPATYTAAPTGEGLAFTLTTSKGKCQIQGDASLLCADSVTEPSVFGYDGSYLTYDGSSMLYANELPSGTAQGKVFVEPKAVSLQAYWIPS